MNALTAISTKYLPATTTRPRRIKATAMSDKPVSVTISEPIEDTPYLDWHRAAADALCVKMGWDYKLVAGATATGFVFVQIPESKTKQDTRYDGQTVHTSDDRTATWELRHDHTGHIPKPEKIWYLICDDCGEAITGEACDCDDARPVANS